MDNNKMRSVEQFVCPLCHTRKAEVELEGLTDKLYSVAGVWNMDRCSECGLLYLNPMPLPEEIGKAYVNYYTHSGEKANILSFLRPFERSYVDVRYGYATSVTLSTRLRYWIIRLFPTEKAEIDIRYFYLDGKTKGRLLDVGCGSGDMIRRLAGKGWDVEGIDFDQGAVNQCIQSGIKAKVGDIFSARYASDTFDVITLNHVIEHLFNPEEVLRECFRILRPGGRLVLATPNSRSRLFRKFRHRWFCLQAPAHLQLFNSENLSSAAMRVGFSLKKVFTTCRNEHWIFATSVLIGKQGYFRLGKDKPSKRLLLRGKWAQVRTWFSLLLNPKIGSEVVVLAVKPENNE